MWCNFFYFLFVLYCVSGKSREIKCPNYCRCDVFETLRRASCQNKTLYSIEVGIPSQAQIVDLSYNQISELAKNIFLEIDLTNLKLLNLSHNKISQIHLNGFEGLNRLRTLDLSYNSLRYFSDGWFASLASLEEFYLRGNNLKSINQEPSLDFRYLRTLDISCCAIETLHTNVFRYLPNLEILDVSENYLINLKIEVIRPLSKLYYLKVKGNHFRCKDMDVERLRRYAAKHLIAYEDPCRGIGRRRKPEKFQRMMVAPPTEKNVWIYDEEEERNSKVVMMCNSTEAEFNGTNPVGFEGNKFENFVMSIISLSPLLGLFVVLVVGVFVGLLLGCMCQLDHQRPHQNVKQYSDNSDDETVSLPSGFTPSLEWTLRRQSNLEHQYPESMKVTRQISAASSFRPKTKGTTIQSNRKTWREDRPLPPFPTDTDAGDYDVPLDRYLRQISTSSFRPRTESISNREDKNVLLHNESHWWDSTPVLLRRDVGIS